jgi:hypothetical protein
MIDETFPSSMAFASECDNLRSEAGTERSNPESNLTETPENTG